MRYLFYLSCILLFLSSCQPREIRAVTSKSQPYVRLKDGTVIHTHEIKWSFGAFDKELNINGVPFAKSEVSSYSNGYNTFADVHKDKFGVMVSEGKINVYKTQFKHKLKPHTKYGNYGGPYVKSYGDLKSFSPFGSFYIQNLQHPNYRAIQKLNYKNLEPMIPKDALAYTYLRQYKHQRDKTNITALAGFGIFTGGAILLNMHGKNAAKNQGIGWGMIGGGAALTGISLAIKLPIFYKLYEIVKVYN